MQSRGRKSDHADTLGYHADKTMQSRGSRLNPAVLKAIMQTLPCSHGAADLSMQPHRLSCRHTDAANQAVSAAWAAVYLRAMECWDMLYVFCMPIKHSTLAAHLVSRRLPTSRILPLHQQCTSTSTTCCL
eukprot:scaffold44416_cov18-Tisochrysis_lutea.AAC.1